MMTKSIQQEIAPAQVAPVSVAPSSDPLPVRTASEKGTAAQPSAPASARIASPAPVATQSTETAASVKEGAIVTTEEEMEIFRAISRICGQSAAKVPLKYKDGTNFFAINLGPVRTWFLRLFAGSRRKSLVARIPVAQAESLARGFQVEAIPENLEKSRIYFNSVADMEKLQLLILRAYEDAVRRQASGGSEGEESSD